MKPVHVPHVLLDPIPPPTSLLPALLVLMVKERLNRVLLIQKVVSVVLRVLSCRTKNTSVNVVSVVTTSSPMARDVPTNVKNVPRDPSLVLRPLLVLHVNLVRSLQKSMNIVRNVVVVHPVHIPLHVDPSLVNLVLSVQLPTLFNQVVLLYVLDHFVLLLVRLVVKEYPVKYQSVNRVP